VQDLDQNIDFSGIHENKVTMITGQGQTVHWKNSNVTVIETDEQWEELYTPLEGNRQGSLKVPLGTVLYITRGQYVEQTIEE
jgi:hypothetical protein